MTLDMGPWGGDTASRGQVRSKKKKEKKKKRPTRRTDDMISLQGNKEKKEKDKAEIE